MANNESSNLDAKIIAALCTNAISEGRLADMLSTLTASVLSIQQFLIEACDDDDKTKAEFGDELVKATLNGLVDASHDKKYLPYKRYVKCYKTKDNEQKKNND